MRPDEGPKTDRAFVFDSWLRTMAYDLDVPDDDAARAKFWRAQKPVIASLLARGKTLVACSRIDPDEIMGWACAEPPGLLHFVLVKGGTQRMGVCRSLLKSLGMGREATASHHTVRGFPRVQRCFETLTLDLLAAGEERE